MDMGFESAPMAADAAATPSSPAPYSAAMLALERVRSLLAVITLIPKPYSSTVCLSCGKRLGFAHVSQYQDLPAPSLCQSMRDQCSPAAG